MVQSAVVIGAGFGGLSAALTLATAGQRVTVVERSDELGGKARNVEIAGTMVPCGPTVLTMRHVFDRLLSKAGVAIEDRLEIAPLNILAHHRWSEGETLDLFHDQEESAAAVEAFAGSREADGYRTFTAEAARIYHYLERSFIHAPAPDLFGVAMSVGPFAAYRIRPFETLWAAISQHFKDERLRQLFGRYATYCGSSPFAAPATLMLVAHVEQAGVWTLPGGTAALAGLISDEIRKHGGEIRTGTAVDEIRVKGDRAVGVIAAGEEIPADTVVFNGDAAALNAGLLGRAVSRTGARIGPRDRSLSAVTFCARLRGAEPLGYHTVAFGRDYRAEFDALFKARRMPDDPTIYVCAPEPPIGASADGQGGDGQGALIIMNAPADGDERPYSEEDIAQCQTQAMETLRRCGLAASLSEVIPTTPADFSQKLPGTGGAIYGRSSHGWTASFQRPALKTRVKGLYLAGGSVHPGPGAPMSALSGMMAGEMILKDFGLVPTSRQEATPGGTSTGSPRTARMR